MAYRFFVLFLFFISSVSLAAEEVDEPYFLSKNSIDIEKVLGDPPAANSKEMAEDLEKVLSYQETRTKAECDRAIFESTAKVAKLFGPIYGPLSDAEVELVSKFFKKVRMDVDYFAQTTKNYYKRPRPFVNEPRVKPCLPKPGSYSYPSGHGTIARIFELLLTKLDPKRAPLYQVRANTIAQDRVLGGVHFPSDVAAGARLGEVIFEKMLKSPVFQKEFKELQQLWNEAKSGKDKARARHSNCDGPWNGPVTVSTVVWNLDVHAEVRLAS